MAPSQDIDSTPPPASREAAVIFAELVGAAELYARLGDAAAHDAIAPCVETLQRSAESTQARFVKRIGGRLMLLSGSADAAARTAVAMQVAAADFPAAGDTRLGLGEIGRASCRERGEMTWVGR